MRVFLQKLRVLMHTFAKHPDERMSILRSVISELWATGRKPLIAIGVAGIVFLVLTPIATYLYFVRDLGSKERIIARNNKGVILLDRNEKPFFTFYEAVTKESISFSSIPEHVKQAVIAIEDKDFYEHQGVSPTSILRAIVTNIREERIAIGGSTITQQLIKNALLSPERTFLRKYQEAFLALEVDRRYSKDDILEMYLNTVYFGENAFGIEDAARRYFNKSASELTLAEGALLAGLLPAPSRYSPISGDYDRAIIRQETVLSEMEKQGYITEEERINAEEQELILDEEASEENSRAPHFALMVIDQLIREYGEQEVARSGYTVKTTIDLTQQSFAEDVVERQVIALRGNRATNGAAVALDPNTGEILTLVGSYDWFDEDNGKINMALAPRQPGSSFKPIIYAAGFEKEYITPATLLEDKPITFPGGYTPRNYDGRFRNEVLVRIALANSLNIPALHVMELVGVDLGVKFAQRLGITTLDEDLDYGLPLILGAAEVPLLEMTSAYSVFASEGYLAKPVAILEIRDKNGNLVEEFEPDRERVLSRDVSFLISNILSDNTARAETFGNALTVARPAAVKTGTTEEYRDALTIGYTPNIVVGVWIGNNDRAPMTSVAGSLGAAPIWRQIIQRFFQDLPLENFQRPSGIIEQLVCKADGKKAIDPPEDIANEIAYEEFFIRGTVPTEICFEPSPTTTVTPTPQATSTPQPQPTNTPQPSSTPAPAVTNTPAPTSILPTITPTIPPLLSTPTPTP